MRNTSILTSEISSLEDVIKHAETMLKESNAIKQYGSDLQIFIGSKSMEQGVNRLNNNLQELVKKKNMKQVVKLKWNSKLNEVIKTILSLGHILEEETPIAVDLRSDLGTQVQILPSPPTVSLDNINIKLKSKFQITGEAIKVRGCSVFPNNKTIFAECGFSKIILFKETHEKEKVFPTSSGPWDVTIIDDNTVAVSTGKGVEVINITSNTVEKTINVGMCHGLDYYKGSLFCCVPKKGVLSVDLASSSSSTVVDDTDSNRDFSWYLYYCAINNDRIYTSRSTNHTITCYTIGGDKVWEFKNQSVIDLPLGIAVGNSSNVYIASYNNHSIVVLSPDGQRHRTLLTQKEGIYFPHALHFDRSRNELLVGNERGPGFSFSI